jgi:two-component system, NtrC family, nitrogen regulation sensor histidine kinase NtrY
MAFKSYRISIALRIALLALTIYFFFFLLDGRRYPLTVAMVGALSLAQCWLLFNYTDRINRRWTRFFEAVRNADFTQNYVFPPDSSLNDLRREYSLVMDILRKYSLEKETHYQYIRTITRSIGVGILVFDRKGDVDFCNEAFRDMLGTRSIRNIDEMETVNDDLRRLFREMKNGDKELFHANLEGDWLRLIVSVTDFVMLREKFRLVTIQNIRQELEENEIDAWQKLARVLTHEIMNSITPISSLASTAKEILAKRLDRKNIVPPGAAEWPAEGDGQRDVLSALQSIERRSRSLLVFVENYRKYLGIPKPALGSVFCADILPRVKALMSGALEEGKIALRFRIDPPDMELTADDDLLEQALINLVKNSIEALAKTKKPSIDLSAYLDGHNRPVIEVSDNGPGIAEDILDKVFIPFFTTKKEGSGIGLSLSRQIMRLHNGTITVMSVPGVRTTFCLKF